jgi:hypothetical protein
MVHRQLLRLVKSPKFDQPPNMPSASDASSDSIDFHCGNCGILLIRANKGQVHGAFIHCTECGACNTSDRMKNQ